MRTDTKKIANNITDVLATAITHIPNSKKLTSTIHKSAKKLAKKLMKLQGKVIQTTPIIIEKIIANTNHKATTHKVVVARSK
jgi:hypothetical protein